MEEKKSIIKRITSMDDIFTIGGKTLEQIISPSDTDDEIGYKVLKFGISVLNEGVKVDFSDDNQRKWQPYFTYESGVGLSYGVCVIWLTRTAVGPAFCYLSYDTMKHGLAIMAEYYNKFYNSNL